MPRSSTAWELAYAKRAEPQRSKRPATDRRTEGYAAKCAVAWAEADAMCFGFGATVDLAAKLEREHRADRYVQEMEVKLRRWPASSCKARVLAPGPAELSCAGLPATTWTVTRKDWIGYSLARLWSDSSVHWQARAFAPAITDQSLFQALRNLWVTHNAHSLARSDCSFPGALCLQLALPVDQQLPRRPAA